MTGLGAGFILLFLLLYQTRTCRCNYADILWGQCYAFCLTQHESRLYQGEDDTDHGVTIKKCRRDRVCKWCLHACERPRKEYQDEASCIIHCQKTRPRDNDAGREACNNSCSFIHRTFLVKYGTCPRFVDGDDDEDVEEKDEGMSAYVVAAAATGGGSSECRNQCQRDVDCDHMLKCCTKGCRKTCVKAIEWNSLPQVPDNLRFKTRRDGSTMVEWNKVTPENSTNPVLYVLRWWCSYNTGVIASLTTKLKLRLKGYSHSDGLHPGQTCHFMLAAVNQFGSQGFSDARQHTKKFLRPSKPGNLETVRSKLQNQKVDVTIQWQPPIYTDNLPISRYLVLWSDPLPRAVPEYERRHMHNKTLDGDKTSHTISGLEPGTVYFVQVRAVVNWKKRSIKGDPVSTYLETYSVPRAVEPVEPGGVEEETSANSAIYNISISKPAFVQSQLKVWVTWHVHSGIDVVKYMLYWVPEACSGEAEHRKTKDRLENEATTHKNEFLLYNLLSDCQYELRIHAVNYLGEMDEGRREVFRTPPCMETHRALPALCPAPEPPPLSPIDVSMRFKTSSSCVCQAVLSWRQDRDGRVEKRDLPDHHQQQQQISSSFPSSLEEEEDETDVVTVWNIVWGESRASGADMTGSGSSTLFQAATIVYNTLPYQSQVPGKETKACLTYLENSKHYTVQIIGQSGSTKGEPAVFHFVTPDYIPLCYTDLDRMEGSNVEATSQDSLDLSSREAESDTSHGNAGISSNVFGTRLDYFRVFFVAAMAMLVLSLCE